MNAVLYKSTVSTREQKRACFVSRDVVRLADLRCSLYGACSIYVYIYICELVKCETPLSSIAASLYLK